jgi:hypothetical protein
MLNEGLRRLTAGGILKYLEDVPAKDSIGMGIPVR